MSRCQDIYDQIVQLGYPAIKQFVEDREFENLFLDFKRSSDGGHGNRLSQPDRQNLAKAISGFGNSEGGVIVWGVDCSEDNDGADVAHEETMINNPVRFASLLQGVISGCTTPPHKDVMIHVVDTITDKGFVVTLIPKSNAAPHQTLYNKRYYIRAGSDFIPTPHDVLAGMFGSRPQPDLYHKWVVGTPELTADYLKCGIGLLILNYGRGIASDIYCTLVKSNLPGPNCRMELESTEHSNVNWKRRLGFGIYFSAVSTWDYRLPPDCFDQPVAIQLYLAPPFVNSLRLSGTIGSGTSGKRGFELEQDANSIETIHDQLRRKLSSNSTDEDELNDLVVEMLGLENTNEMENSD